MEGTLPDRLARLLSDARSSSELFVALTGAGISQESGIPTFRGEEGYWRVGSRNYHPQELATYESFSAMPEEVWAWYLYRRGVCRGAEPNPAHRALVRLEETLGDRFVLVTQNVDGLHVRAGSSPDRTYEIHGNIDRMRCARECNSETFPIPESVEVNWAKGRAVGPQERDSLRCPRCGGPSRPHVLWFDEYYDEEHFKFDSSMAAALEAGTLLVIGTSGATNLPVRIGQTVAARGAAIIAVNPEPSIFTEFASRSARGFFAEGKAGDLVPKIVEALTSPGRP